MTVKCLNNSDKLVLIRWYRNKDFNQKQLAMQFNVSERTVNRVLTEVGLATPVARIKGDAYRVMNMLKKHDIDVDQLDMLLILGKAQLQQIEDDLIEDQAAYMNYQQMVEDVPF